jgi:hypothetical protein
MVIFCAVWPVTYAGIPLSLLLTRHYRQSRVQRSFSLVVAVISSAVQDANCERWRQREILNLGSLVYGNLFHFCRAHNVCSRNLPCDSSSMMMMYPYFLMAWVLVPYVHSRLTLLTLLPLLYPCPCCAPLPSPCLSFRTLP